METYIFFCAEHRRALVNGFCVECDCIVDLQSTYLVDTRSQKYSPVNQGYLTEEKHLKLQRRLKDLEPGTALKLQRLKNELELDGWSEMITAITKFVAEHPKYYFLENPRTTGYTYTWLARD